MTFDVSLLSRDDLERLQIAVHAELTKRALDEADTAALTEEGFRIGFARTGLADDPYLRSGLLICMGAKIDKSAMAHQCTFVRVGGTWAWEFADVVSDTVRHLPGAKPRMQSVTIVAAPLGSEVDLVTARTRHGVHELVGVRSFTITADGLDLVSTRAVKPISHRL